MSELRPTAEEPAVEDDAAPHARSERQHHEVRSTATRPEPPLGQRRGVPVVLDAHRQSEAGPGMADEIEVAEREIDRAQQPARRALEVRRDAVAERATRSSTRLSTAASSAAITSLSEPSGVWSSCRAWIRPSRSTTPASVFVPPRSTPITSSGGALTARATIASRMAVGDKPYRLYRGGRAKGKVPLERPPRATAPPKAPPASKRRRRWWVWALLGLAGLLVLALVWGVLGFLSFSNGVDKANERLPRRAYNRLAKLDGSLLSEPATTLVIGTDGEHDSRSRRTPEALGLAPPRAHRPGQASDHVPLDPARPPGRHPRLRLGEDQLREPVRRAGADARDGAQPHRPPDRPRRRRRLRRLQRSDRRPRRNRGSTSRSRSSRTPSTARTRPSGARRGRAGDSGRARSTWTVGARSSTRASARTSSTRPSRTSPRTARQQAVADAVGDKIASVGTFLRLPFMGDSLASPLATDLSARGSSPSSAGFGSAPTRAARSAAGSAASRPRSAGSR